jgi:hypothetical protein
VASSHRLGVVREVSEHLLLAKVAAGKRVIPKIYQRYLKPSEQLLTLAQNTYGRKAGGARMAEPPACAPDHRTAASNGQNEH